MTEELRVAFPRREILPASQCALALGTRVCASAEKFEGDLAPSDSNLSAR
jgi:hypothetical protein